MRFTLFLERVSIWMCRILLSVLVLSVFIDVVLRYIFRQGFLAANEFVPYLFTWLSFVGASLAVRRQEHLAVDIVLISVSGRVKLVLEAIIHLAELGFFILLSYYGWVMTMQTMVQRTPYLELPYGYIYLSVPVAGFFMTVYTAETLIGSFKNLFQSPNTIGTGV